MSATLTTINFACTQSIDTWQVPAGVTSLNILATGASGGRGAGTPGAPGAFVGGTFPVSPGDILSILVGQKGGDSADAGGGGGGGSFVVKGALAPNATLLVAAGGGGGGGALTAVAAGPGEITLNGGIAGGGGFAGANGLGGASPQDAGDRDACGGGGAGFLGSAGTNPVGSVAAEAITSGALGGAGQSAGGGTGGPGGFGGGGGAGGGSMSAKATAGGGGGGGGYSGGCGNSAGGGGGGGGSLNATSDLLSRIEARGGGIAGADGAVSISYIWTDASTEPATDPAYPDGPVPAGSGPQVLPARETQGGFAPSAWDALAYPMGMMVTCQWPTEPQYRIDRIEWQFGADDLADLAGDYVQTSVLGSPMPLVSRTLQNLPLFPLRAHQYNFDVTLNVTWLEDGKKERIVSDGYFTMAMPTGSLEGANVDRPRIVQMPATETYPNGYARVRLGNGLLNIRGIQLLFRATVPGDGAGTVSVIQLVKGYRRLTAANGAVTDATTGNNWYLDTDIPYPTTAPATSPIAARGNCEIMCADGPGMPLPNGCNKVEIAETFQTHLVYKPVEPNSRWASIGYVQWSWAATVTRDARGHWPLVVDSGSVTQLADLDFVPSDAPIVWADNIRTLAAQIAAAYVLPLQPYDPTPALAAAQRQMLVQCGPEVTAKALSAALMVPIGPAINSPQGFLVWTTPDAAKGAASLAGVTSVAELSQDLRFVHAKTPAAQATLDAATAFAVVVAPFCLFPPDEDSQAFPNQNAPLALDEVAEALITIAANAGPTPTVLLRPPYAITLTFATPPGSSLLPLLAEHPQVNYVELVPEFQFDDPVDPSR